MEVEEEILHTPILAHFCFLGPAYFLLVKRTNWFWTASSCTSMLSYATP